MGHQHATHARGEYMGRRKMICGNRRTGAPSSYRLLLKWPDTFVPAGQIGEETVDPSLVQSAHDFSRLPTKLVCFIKEGRKEQQAPPASLVEGQGHLLSDRSIGAGCWPVYIHSGRLPCDNLRLCKGEESAVGFEHFAVDVIIFDNDIEAIFHFRKQTGDGH